MLKCLLKDIQTFLKGPFQWQQIKTEKSSIYNWDQGSTYVKKPPFFETYQTNQRVLNK